MILKARCNIDAIAEDIVVVDPSDVADVDADLETSILSSGGTSAISLNHLALDFYRTARCIDSTCELDQHAITGGLDDATVMRGDSGIDERLSKRLKLRECALLVATHQQAIAGDIRRQHGRQSPLHALAGQKGHLDW